MEKESVSVGDSTDQRIGESINVCPSAQFAAVQPAGQRHDDVSACPRNLEAHCRGCAY